ncbi:MAG: alpha/beta fold hydrolase [Gemmatimonadales bacterium]|nr:alpha/beta fold hydrolase [Gemmatimonadales bacterium]
MRRVVQALTLFAMLSIVGHPVTYRELAAQDRLDGRWHGAILVLGSELGIVVGFETTDTGLSATIDIEQQGAMGIPLTAVSFDPPKVHFELPAGPGLAVFDGELTGDSIGGPFTQAGVAGTFWLKRGEPKPEAPAEPVPYLEEEVQFANGDVTLAGTLTLPEGGGPHPAVVMITGSGPQNRDEELFGFKPFRIIADHLTRNGLAVLRYDDRGVGGSTGNTMAATSSDFADDALAAVRLLVERTEIDSEAIGLVGHSEGALVAAIAASRSPDLAFIVMLAGTAVSGEEILYAQSALIMRANGATDEEVSDNAALQRQIFEAVRTDEGWEAVRQGVEVQIRRSIDDLPAERRQEITDVDSLVASRVEQQLVAVRSPWFRSFLDYNPATDLEHVRVPVLAVFGENDLQVPPAVNRVPMEQALQKAGNADYTITVIPGANHLFLASETGNPSEYATQEKVFVPELLETVTTWLTERWGGQR